MCELKRCDVGVDPWLLRVEDTPNYDSDESVVNVHLDMCWEILDTRVNLLPLAVEPGEQIGGAGIIIHLNIDDVSRETRTDRQKIGHTNEDVGVIDLKGLGNC